MAVDAQGFLARKRHEPQEGGNMTKQDYDRIAAVIRNAWMHKSERAALILNMEDAFRDVDPYWDSKRWHDACRPPDMSVLEGEPTLPVGVLRAYPTT